MTAAPTARSVGEWLARYPVENPPISSAGAAVTIVLRAGPAGAEALLIERTERSSDPASGQVALPGGHVDDRDGNLADTAARELEEEVGLTLADLDGPLHFIAVEQAARFRLKVGTFAGALGPVARSPFARSADEVAHVFWLPVGALGTTRRVHRETVHGELEVPATVFEGHVVWGFTRRVLRGFFEYPDEDELGGPIFPLPPSDRPA